MRLKKKQPKRSVNLRADSLKIYFFLREGIQINKIRNEKEVVTDIVEITAYKRLVADTF